MANKNTKNIQAKQNKSIFIIIFIVFIGAIVAYTFMPSKNESLSNANNNILKSKNSFVIGKKDAKIQVVDFFDPACGACGQSHFFVKDLMDVNKEIQVTLRYAPLFPDSKRVAILLEATKKQDMFLESLDATLNSQNKWVGKQKHNFDALLEIVSNLGLDMQKLKNDMKSSDVINAVEQDIKDKNELGIKRTPTYYINGKLLEKYSLTNLRDTILNESNK